MKKLREAVLQKYLSRNRLHGVMLELTHSCPSRCIHCLIKREEGDELSSDEISDLLLQLKNEGVLSVCLSGGDPFAREDFPDILESLRKHEFFFPILTTGILVDTPEVNLLKKMGVWDVELSLLGGNPDTHDMIMQRPGAFNKMINAARLLRSRDINVTLKSVIMKHNYTELGSMAKIAYDLKCMFTVSMLISPRIDGNRSPQNHSLTIDEIQKLDLKYINGGVIPGEDTKTGALLSCQAGKVVAGISPRGDIFPCIIMRHRVGNIRERTLEDIWHERPDKFLIELRKLRKEDVAECYNCDIKNYCPRCPGVAFLENGNILGRSEAACNCAKGISQCN